VASNDIEDSLYFLKRFLQGPRQVASVWPSSRFLAERMLADLDLDDGDLVVEYGPGTGAFTRGIETLRAQGRQLRYLGVEKDAGMHRFLEQRFPDLDFVHGDATDVLRHCAERRLPPASAIISGLPLIFFDCGTIRAILQATSNCLHPAGLFRTFSYVHSYPSRGAGDLRALMSCFFEDFELGRPVIRNLPPAFTLTGRVPVPGAGSGGRFPLVANSC